VQRLRSRASQLILVLSSLAFACALVRPVAAKEARRVLFLRQSSSPADAELVEALRIQLAGGAELIELHATPLGSEASAAWRTTHAELVVWIDDEPGGSVLALRASAPSVPVALGAQPDGADACRVLALKISELLELEPDFVPVSEPPSPRRPPSTIAFLELRAGATHGGSPSFWLPSLGFAAGPRFLKPHGFGEVYGIFGLSADVRALSRLGEVDTSLAYVGVGGRALRSWDGAALGPYLELGLMVLRARGFVDAKHKGGAELRAPLAQAGLEGRLLLQPFELRAAAGAEIWLERQRLELHATPVLDFGRARPVLSASVILPLR
jgi:hypothetical protein